MGGRLVLRRLTAQRGLSLIELLVVVAIVALLTAVAAPRMQAAADRSKEALVAQDLQSIADALETHYLAHSYYPVKLNDLVARGHLKPTSFRSPVTGYWYFYAVDDNRADGLAQAYALGAPPRGAESESKRRLYRGGQIPQGRDPSKKARAWLRWNTSEVSGYDRLYLDLYAVDRRRKLPDDQRPSSLSEYRDSCRPGARGPCDLITN